MNQFPTLIEYLLLNHNYVVIPELGTFITQEMDARWNEVEETFQPPCRSVRFNAGLKQDDNLLLNAIAEIYSVTVEQASQMLTTWTLDFRQTLDDCGCLDFGTIGTFTLEDDGTMLFISQESGISTPEFYGLDVFHFSQVQPAQRKHTVPMAATMETSDHEITIRINRRIANYIVAASAAILLFLVFNSPIADQRITDQRSSLKELLLPMTLYDNNSEALAGKAKEAEGKAGQAPQTPQAEVAEAQPQAEAVEAEPQAPSQSAQPLDEKGGYCIVMASSIPRANAERFVAQLNADGFPQVRILENGKMLRVAVGYYTDKQEAYNFLNEVRQRSPQYRAAWLYQF